MGMRMEHLISLDSISFLPFALRKLREAFGLKVSIAWYPHYFNTKQNLDHVDKIPNVSYYGADGIIARQESCSRGTKVEGPKSFITGASWNNVNLTSPLREACQVFRREFI